jgi:ribonuclease HII
MRDKLLEEIDKKIEENKGTFFINGTGTYGTPFKKQVIERFKLNDNYSQKVMRLSFGDIKTIMDNLN